MSFTSIFLFIVFALVFLVLILIKLLDTSAGRIFLINWRMDREEKKKKKELENFQTLTLEQAKYPDEFLKLISKIRTGERVDIPLAAFSYIYKNLDKFTIVDKDGNLTIMNYEKFKEFKDNATGLIEQNKEKKIDIGKIIEQQKEKVAKNPIEVIEYPDGTFVKKDYIAKTIEITKPNDEKMIIDMENDDMIIEKTKEEKEDKQNSKKEYAEAEQKKETKTKSLEQENKLLKNKIKEFEDKKNTTKTDNAQEDIEENISPVDIALNQVKIKEEIISQKEQIEEQIEEETEGKEESKNEEKPEIRKVEKEIKEKEEKQEKSEQNSPKVKLTFDGNFDTYCNQIKHKYILDILLFVVSYDTNSCRKFVIYDNNIACILINTYWFIYRLSLLIENENERETFLNVIFSDRKKGFIENSFLIFTMAIYR